jgi:hypothetical protein
LNTPHSTNESDTHQPVADRDRSKEIMCIYPL